MQKADRFGDLLRVTPGAGVLDAAPDWAQGMEFRVPRVSLEAASSPAMLAREGNALRMRCAFTERKPASSRLPISYRSVAPRIRSALASLLGRWKRRSMAQWAAFPAWPLDLSADLLADLAGGPPSPFSRGPTPVLLTHDLDSPEGLENLVGRFLAAEEAAGARSTSYVVPCAWELDHGLLEETARRGHELGIHGYDHSNLTPFAIGVERDRRVRAALPLAQRYGMKGYRAPSLLRTRELLQAVAQHYRYDSSIPTSGGLFPVPNNGCASARPFFVEGILEIPVSMPRDGSLRFLGVAPRDILAMWIECAERISRSGGVVVLLAHCEDRFSGNPAMFDTYRRFLDHVASNPRYAWSTPMHVVEACANAGMHA